MKNILFSIALLIALNLQAQDDKTVTLVVSGQGKTQEEARQNALRSAIEQAFGTFISSKTEILNDNLVKDEIVSVANGNIQKFEIISEVQIPKGEYITSLKAIVSVTKLTSFVESKGVNIEFKGGLFASNIQNQELSAKNETICLNNLKQSLNIFSTSAFDYEINVSDPFLNKTATSLYEVPIKVSCRANNNLKNWVLLFQKTITELAMMREEINNYTQLHKSTFIFQLEDKKKNKNLYFRNEESIKVINEIFVYLVYGIQNFEIKNDIKVFDLNTLKTRQREWYTSNNQSNIQQRQINYLMDKFNFRNFGRFGPNRFDGCYPCLFEKDYFYLINEPDNLGTKMNNNISFGAIMELVGKVVAVYEFNDVLKLDDLKQITKYEVNEKKSSQSTLKNSADDSTSIFKYEKENSVSISKSGNSVKVSLYELSSFGSLSIELENSKIYQGKFIRESSPYFFEFKDSTGMIFTINTNDILRITTN